MAENAQYIKELTGLDKEDLRVYAEMLRHGFGTSSYLAEYTGLKKSSIEKILVKLNGKNLVKTMPGAVPRFIPMRPYGELVKYMETFYTEAIDQQKQLKEFNAMNITQFAEITEQLNLQSGDLLTSMESKLAQIQAEDKTKIENSFENTKSKTLATANQIPSRLTEKLGTVISDFQTKISQVRNELEESIQKTVDETDSKIKTHINTIQKQTQDLSEKLKTDTTQAKQELSNKIASMKSGLNTIISEYKTTINQSLDQFLKDLSLNKKNAEEQVQSVVNVIQNGLNDSQNKFQNEWEGFKSESKTLVSEMNNQITQNLTQAISTIKEQLTGFLNNTTQTLTDYRSNIQAICEQTQKDVKNQCEQLNNTTTNGMTQLISQSETQNKLIQSQLTETLTQNIQSTNQNISQFGDKIILQINTTLDQGFTQLNDATGKFKERIKSEADREVARFKSVGQKTLGGNIDAYLKKLEEQAGIFQGVFKDQINDFVVDVDDIYDKKRKELGIKFATNPELVTQLEQFLTDNIDKLKTLQDKFKTKFADAISKEVVRLKADGKTALEKLQNDYILQVEAQGELYQQAFKDEVAKVVNGISANATGLKTQFSTDVLKERDSQTAANTNGMVQTQDFTLNEINKWSQNLIGETQKIGANVSSNISEITNVIGEKLTQIKEQGTNLTENIQSGINSQTQSSIANNTDTLKQLMESFKQQLISKIDGWEQTGNARNLAIQQILTNQFDQFQKEIQRKVAEDVRVPELTPTPLHTAIDQGEQLVLNSIETNFIQITSSADKATDQWNGNVESFHSHLNEEIVQLKESNTSHRTATEDKITNYQAEIDDKFKTSVEAVGIAGAQELSTIEGDLQNDLITVKSGLDQIIADLSSQITNQVQTIQTSLKDRLNASETQLNQKSQEIFNNVAELVQKIVIASEKPLKILKQSWMDMQATNLLAVDNTWVVAGQQGIMPFIVEMVGRTQKSLKLVVPDLDALDVKELQNMAKKGANITIITNTQKAKKNKPEKVAEKGIQLFDSPEDDLYIAIRDDDQEVLLAPMNAEKIGDGNIELGPDGADEEITISAELCKKLGEKVAIVSIQSEFVKKLNRLAELLESQAKKI